MFVQQMNQFGDLTAEEFQKMNNGLKIDSEKLRASAISQNVDEIDVSALPKSIDWRTKGAVTAVKNQGQCGSCWAFSTTGSLEGANFLATGKLLSLSEQELVSCATEGNMGCNGGLMDNAFKWIENDNKGITSEKDYPYASGMGSMPACQKASHANVADVKTYTDVAQNDPKALMAAVAQQPVSIAIEADKHVFQFYNKGIIKEGSCGTNLDHGVLIVGYGAENGKGYWLVKNSWATSWGESGYVRLERDITKNGPGTCGIQMKASYPTATKTVPPSPPPTPPAPGPGPSCGILKTHTCPSGKTCCCLKKLFFCQNWDCCPENDDGCMKQCVSI